MKFKYKKSGKLNYNGTQIHKGQIVEADDYPMGLKDYFEIVEEKNHEFVEPVDKTFKSKKTGGKF